MLKFYNIKIIKVLFLFIKSVFSGFYKPSYILLSPNASKTPHFKFWNHEIIVALLESLLFSSFLNKKFIIHKAIKNFLFENKIAYIHHKFLTLKLIPIFNHYLKHMFVKKGSKTAKYVYLYFILLKAYKKKNRHVFFFLSYSVVHFLKKLFKNTFFYRYFISSYIITPYKYFLIPFIFIKKCFNKIYLKHLSKTNFNLFNEVFTYIIIIFCYYFGYGFYIWFKKTVFFKTIFRLITYYKSIWEKAFEVEPEMYSKVLYDLFFVYPLDKMFNDCYVLFLLCFSFPFLVLTTLGFLGILYSSISVNTIANFIRFICRNLYNSFVRIALTPYVILSFVKNTSIPKVSLYLKETAYLVYNKISEVNINIPFFTSFFIKYIDPGIDFLDNTFIRCGNSLRNLKMSLKMSMFNIHSNKIIPFFDHLHSYRIFRAVFYFFLFNRINKKYTFLMINILLPVYVYFVWKNYYEIAFRIYIMKALLYNCKVWAVFYYEYPPVAIKHFKALMALIFYKLDRLFGAMLIYDYESLHPVTYIGNLSNLGFNLFISLVLLVILIIILIWIKEYHIDGVDIYKERERRWKRDKNLKQLIGRKQNLDYYLIAFEVYYWYHGKWRLYNIMVYCCFPIFLAYGHNMDAVEVLDKDIHDWEGFNRKISVIIEDLKKDKITVDADNARIEEELVKLRKTYELKKKADSITPTMDLLYRTINSIRKYTWGS